MPGGIPPAIPVWQATLTVEMKVTLSAVRCGAYTEIVYKVFGEMSWICKTQVVTDFRDRLVREEQCPLGFQYDPLLQDFGWRGTRQGPANAAQ